MSQARFLCDHDLNEHIVGGVLRREPAVEFIRAREVGLENQPDSGVLEYASVHGLIVISHDVNTMPAAAYDRLAAGQKVAGLMMVRQAAPIGPVIEDLVYIWSASDAEEWEGQVVFLPI